MSARMTPFSETVEDMSERNRLAQPPDEKDYTGKDGLLYCHRCNKPRQKRVDFGDVGVRLVFVNCDCMNEKAEQREKERQQEQLRKKSEELRKAAFPNMRMREWTFAHDDRKNPKVSDALGRYVDKFDTFYKDGVGLLLYGTVGTGKTYLAACVANGIIDQGKPAFMTNFSRILNELQNNPQRQEYIDKLCTPSLLVIDDLGMERDSAYAREQIYNVIDSRCCSGKPLIITTNLTLTEMVQCQETERKRIYDRILDVCHAVKMVGESRRAESARNRLPEIKAILGI